MDLLVGIVIGAVVVIAVLYIMMRMKGDAQVFDDGGVLEQGISIVRNDTGGNEWLEPCYGDDSLPIPCPPNDRLIAGPIPLYPWPRPGAAREYGVAWTG